MPAMQRSVFLSERMGPCGQIIIYNQWKYNGKRRERQTDRDTYITSCLRFFGKFYAKIDLSLRNACLAPFSLSTRRNVAASL